MVNSNTNLFTSTHPSLPFNNGEHNMYTIIHQDINNEITLHHTNKGTCEFISAVTGDSEEDIILNQYNTRDLDPRDDKVRYFSHLGWTWYKAANDKLLGWMMEPATQEVFKTEFFRHPNVNR